MALVLTAILYNDGAAPQDSADSSLSQGVIIEKVELDSPAHKAGLKVGDHLLTYDGKPLSSPAALQAAQQNTFGKKSVVLHLRRENQSLTLTVPLGLLGIEAHPVFSSGIRGEYEDIKTVWKAQKVFEAVRLSDSTVGKIVRERGDKGAAVFLLGQNGAVLESLKEWQLAQQRYTLAWTLLKESRDVAAQSRILFGLGRCSANLNDLMAAQQWFEQAWQVDAAAGNEWWAADDLMALGNVVYIRGDLTAAQDYYSRALSIHERLAPNSLDVASCLNNLGEVARVRSDLRGAHDYHSRALKIRERLAPDSLVVADSLNNLGAVAFAFGDLETAEDYHSRALKIRERLACDSLHVARSLHNLGLAAYARGNVQDAPLSALDYLTRALAIKERLTPDSLDVATTLSGLGNVAWSRNDFEKAHDNYTRALTIFERQSPDSLNVAHTLNNLGAVALLRNDLPGAHDHLSRALKIYERSVPDSLYFAISLSNLGYLALKESRLSNAWCLFSRSVDIVESQRGHVASPESRSLLVAQHTGRYTGLLRTDLALDDLPAAFYTVERSRARSLVELLAKRQMDFQANISADTTLQEPQPLNLKDVQKNLDSGTLLLSYYVDDKETYLFAVTRKTEGSSLSNEGLRMFRLKVTEQELREKVNKFREIMTGQSLGSLTKEGQTLYNLLVHPAQELVDRAQRVVICPDGPLHVLPFAALVSDVQPRVRYFIEDKPLHTIISATVDNQVRQRAETRKKKRLPSYMPTLVAFGDPIYAKEQLQKKMPAKSVKLTENGGLIPLPHTRKEVEAIARLYRPHARTYLGKEATEATAIREMSRADYLHFACHGFLNERLPRHSALVLTQPEILGMKPKENEGGYLPVWKIFKQVIHADLVVLSACDTGLGQEVAGEGLKGLTRAFLYAGADSIVVSLWTVPDEPSTIALIERFYRELMKNGKSKDVALQEAMVAMYHDRQHRQWNDPKYWASFILVGDWR